MPGWGQVVAVTTGVLVAGGLAVSAGMTVDGIRVTVTAESPAPTASPSPSSSATASPEGCDWATLADADRPPVLTGEPEGLPDAREMTPATWECVDETWAVESRSAGGDTWRPGGTAQALYLVAPDGDLLKLFDLRTDVEVVVVSADLGERVAWTARVGETDSFQVVRMDLTDGFVSETWGGPAVPRVQRRDGAVWDVNAVGTLADGDELWLGYHHLGSVQSLFLRGDGADFHPVVGQQAIDGLYDARGVNGYGERGAEVWVAPDLSYAALLSQESGQGTTGSTGRGTWVILDLDGDQWRLAPASLPEGLCTVAPDAQAQGTASEPGVFAALCWEGETQEVYDLAVGGDPVRREDAGP